MSLRFFEFRQRTNSYFEIDAPETTVAVEKAGMYRVDAQDVQIREKRRITVNQDGEARIYSTNAGFTLRDGRSASLASKAITQANRNWLTPRKYSMTSLTNGMPNPMPRSLNVRDAVLR